MSKKDILKKSLSDFLAVLILIMIFSFVIIVFLSLTGFSSTENGDTVTYEILIKDIKNEVAQNISNEDSVIDSVGKYQIGRVSKVEIFPSEISLPDKSGKKYIKKKNPYKSDIKVTVTAKAKTDENDISINGYKLKVGKKMYLRFPYFVGEGVCISVSSGGAE